MCETYYYFQSMTICRVYGYIFFDEKSFQVENVFVLMNEQYGKCKPEVPYPQTLCYNKAVAWFSIIMVVYNLYHTIDKSKIKVEQV